MQQPRQSRPGVRSAGSSCSALAPSRHSFSAPRSRWLRPARSVVAPARPPRSTRPSHSRFMACARRRRRCCAGPRRGRRAPRARHAREPGQVGQSLSGCIRQELTMHSIKRLLAVMGTIVALMALAPVASAGSHQDFHLDKTCAGDPSEPLGCICTVQHSSFKWIPAGTHVRYLSQSGNVVQARSRSVTAGPVGPARGAASRCDLRLRRRGRAADPVQSRGRRHRQRGPVRVVLGWHVLVRRLSKDRDDS